MDLKKEILDGLPPEKLAAKAKAAPRTTSRFGSSYDETFAAFAEQARATAGKPAPMGRSRFDEKETDPGAETFTSWASGKTAAEDRTRTHSRFGTSAAFDDFARTEAEKRATPTGRSRFNTEGGQGVEFDQVFGPRKHQAEKDDDHEAAKIADQLDAEQDEGDQGAEDK